MHLQRKPFKIDMNVFGCAGVCRLNQSGSLDTHIRTLVWSINDSMNVFVLLTKWNPRFQYKINAFVTPFSFVLFFDSLAHSLACSLILFSFCSRWESVCDYASIVSVYMWIACVTHTFYWHSAYSNFISIAHWVSFWLFVRLPPAERLVCDRLSNDFNVNFGSSKTFL